MHDTRAGKGDDETELSQDGETSGKKKKKKRTKRGQKKAREITLYYNNINGFRSKADSIKEILKKVEPDILALCETKVGNSTVVDNNIEEAGYKGITRNIKNGQGGLVIATRTSSMGRVKNVTTSPLKSILAGRLEIRGGFLRIILGHGPQETENAENREEFFREMAIEIQKARQAGDKVLLVGDMNAKMEDKEEDSEEGSVEEENEVKESLNENDEARLTPTTSNGKLLCQVLEEFDLHVINMSNKCIGKWTHVVRTTGEESRLDYVISDSRTENQIVRMVIDESTLLCPFHIKNKRRVLSDHNAIMVSFRILAKKKAKGGIDGNNKKWIMKPEGIEKLPEKCAEILQEKLPNGTTQVKYDEFENKIKEVLSQCFKETTSNKQNRRGKESGDPKYRHIVHAINTFSKSGKAQRRVAKIYIEHLTEIQMMDVTLKRAERLKEVVEQMTIDGNFNVQKYWKLRKSGNRKRQTCSSVIKDGEEVYDDDLIMKAFSDEFKERLEKPEKEEWLENLSRKIDIILDLITEKIVHKSAPFTMKELKAVIKAIVGGKASGPDEIPPELFKYGGEALEKLLLEMVNEIKESAEIPEQWNNVDISTIYKNKGKMKELKNQRGIFLTAVAYKLFERLMVKRMEDVTENINLLQAGGRKKRSTEHQTFMMRNIINHALYIGKKLFITCYDYKQCFDKLWLQEAVLSMYKLGLTNEYAKLILKLNETSQISIKTPFGKTERFVATSITKQGTVLGPTLCGCSLGECLDLLEGKGGATIGNVSIPALAFVDDMNTLNTKVSDVHSSHENTLWFSKKKNQPLNGDKCEIMCVNSSDGDVVPTISVNGKPVKNVEKIIYIGDGFNRKGSNKDLINDRIAKGMRCLRNTIAECTDTTLGQYAIESSMLLYKTVFVKTILFNCGAWCNLTKQNIESLQVLQMKYLKRILHSPKSTPNIAVLMELGVKPIETEIHIRQLNFLHQILCLDENDPVRRVYEQSKRFEFEKTWFREVKALIQKYDLEDVEENIKEIEKEQWKKQVNERVEATVIKQYNEEYKKGKMTRAYHPLEKLELKEYMKELKPSRARTLFKVRSKTIDLRNVRKYQYKTHSCRLCGDGEESINHVLNICTHMKGEATNESMNEDDIYGNDKEKLEYIVTKFHNFGLKVEEKEKKNAPENSLVTNDE